MRAVPNWTYKPLGAIGRPDADAVTAPDAQREQACGDVVGSLPQIVPGECSSVGREDSRGMSAMPGARPVEQLGDSHEF